MNLSLITKEFCTYCGEDSETREVRPNTANNHACENCGATLRYRAQARSILDHFGKGTCRSLVEARRKGLFHSLDIWEMALRGPLKRVFRDSPRYVRSYYWEDVEPGEKRDDVICQDITNLTFDNGTFDLVISSDVMEHVHDPWKGFSEVARVLKPGGAYIFTIPVRLPLSPNSEVRARIDEGTGEIEHLLPEVYHKSGELDKSLVFTDFGSDIFDRLKEFGLHLSFEPATVASADLNRFGCFVAIKFADSQP